MTIVFTLIATITFWYGNGVAIAHIERDYATKEACHAAYDAVREQANQLTAKSAGTCLANPKVN